MSISPITRPQPQRYAAPVFGRSPVSRTASILPIAGVPVAGVRNYSSRDRVSNELYSLMLKVPKNETHLHAGGSSNVDFLSYCLRKTVEKNNKRYENGIYAKREAFRQQHQADPKIAFPPELVVLDKFPIFQDKGPPKWVYFTDKECKPLSPEHVRDAMEKAFTPDNVSNYHRFQLEAENQKTYMDVHAIAETTASPTRRDGIVTATESEELKKHKADGLNAYRQTSAKINPYVKNNPAAYLLANQLAKTMVSENVRYIEYRVSLSGNGIGGAMGNNVDDMLSSVHSGFEDAKKAINQCNKKLDYGLIVLFERQGIVKGESPQLKVQRAIDLANKVVQLKQEGKYNICAVDLAGNEADNPVTEFKPAFDIIRKYNASVSPEKRLGITIHAGETPNSGQLKGYQSIDESINIGHDENTPVRIGHGLQIINSSTALQKAFDIYCEHPNDWESRIDKADLLKNSPSLKNIIAKGVVLEMCPKSNLQTYGVHPGFPREKFSVNRDEYSAEAYKHHPAVFLSRLGVKVAISSDNRTISNTDVTNEFVKLYKYSGLTYKDLKKMVMNGFEGAFIADPNKKKALIEDVLSEFETIERDPSHRKAIRDMQGKIPFRFAMLWHWGELGAYISDKMYSLGQTLKGWWSGTIGWLARPFGKKQPATT